MTSKVPVDVVVTLSRAGNGGQPYCKIVAWGQHGDGKYGSLWTRCFVIGSAHEDDLSPADLMTRAAVGMLMRIDEDVVAS